MRPSSIGGAAYCVALCLSVCPSVRPTVRHVVVSYLNKYTYRQTLNTVWQGPYPCLLSHAAVTTFQEEPVLRLYLHLYSP